MNGVMADTKRGRDRKARREALAAERRVLEADVAALHSEDAPPDVYPDEDAADGPTLVAYLADPSPERLMEAAEHVERTED